MSEKKENSTALTATILSGIFVLLSACIGGIFMVVNTMVDKGIQTEAPTQEAKSAATQAPAPEVAALPGRQLLFQDSFTDPESGWPDSRGENSYAGYADGRYVIQVFPAKLDAWGNPGRDFGDVSIEVDATKYGGTDNNSFGVICRYQDHDNFYYFLAASDGYQVIGKYQGGENYYLSADKMQSTDVILAGAASNHLRADCMGSALTLYANGRQLSSVTDTAFARGDVGLMVGTFDDPNVSVSFDNFAVYEP